MGLLLLRLQPIEEGGRVHVYEFHFIKGTQLPSGLVAKFALQCPLLGYAYSELPDDSSIQPSSHLQLFVFLDLRHHGEETGHPLCAPSMFMPKESVTIKKNGCLMPLGLGICHVAIDNSNSK